MKIKLYCEMRHSNRTSQFIFVFALSWAHVGVAAETGISPTVKPPSLCERVLGLSKPLFVPVKRSLTLANPRLLPFSEVLELDRRLAVQMLVKASKTFQIVDDFSSPATVKNILFSMEAKNEFFTALRLSSGQKNILAESVKLSPNALAALELFESRFFVAVSIVRLGLLAIGEDPSRIEAEIPLVEQRLAHQFFKEITVGKIVSEADANQVLASLNNSVIDSASIDKNEFSDLIKYFNPSFLRHLKPSESLESTLSRLAEFVEESLMEVPVGFSHTPSLLSSFVRYGSRMYWAGYGTTNSTSRLAYVRQAKSAGGMFDVTLRLSNSEKKKLALILARNHQELDPIFGSPSEWQLDSLQTCGSYPPYSFLRSGVMFLTPTYITPGGTSLSMLVQRALGVKRVEDARMVCFNNPKATPIAIFNLAWHDGTLAFVEIGFYMTLITKAGELVFSLF